MCLCYTLTPHMPVCVHSLISDMLAACNYMKYATTLLLIAYATAESPVAKRAKKMKYKKATRCTKVTTTGKLPGPIVFDGLAAAGTYVSYGTIENSCSEKKFLFDIGRGTTTRLSELGVRPTDIASPICPATMSTTSLSSSQIPTLRLTPVNLRWIAMLC